MKHRVSAGKKPLVSVIVPTRNSSQFLEKCLLSISRQNYPHVEIGVDNKEACNEMFTT